MLLDRKCRLSKVLCDGVVSGGFDGSDLLRSYTFCKYLSNLQQLHFEVTKEMPEMPVHARLL